MVETVRDIRGITSRITRVAETVREIFNLELIRPRLAIGLKPVVLSVATDLPEHLIVPNGLG